ACGSAPNDAPAKSGASDNRDHRDKPGDDVEKVARARANTLHTSWPASHHPPLAGHPDAEKCRASNNRDHRHKAGDDVVVDWTAR
ncbi:hypothetical protein, partial [Microvirga yunnanensis]|uniref:hypothetical protein n=1 Tax=Microvirga yunnanensis TaxID=2953740 RepID=UPI0021C6457D